ncbi:MAG TPA: hypothetical protein VLV90_03040 [Burkholderiales bacterium]|nr:hypothetical protein [Burkholderiales bacterium]
MSRTVIEQLYRIPELDLRLARAARRARAAAVRDGLAKGLAALARFGRSLAPCFDFHPRQWMERLG